MAHPLFSEIDKFEQWAENSHELPQNERYGEWECDYPDWHALNVQFMQFVDSVATQNWTNEVVARLSYIIARENETEQFVEALPDDALVLISEHALVSGERDSKWQLANALPRIANTKKAIDLIEQFVNDPEEYVNRRALMALAKVDPQKAEYYCKAHWERNLYGVVDEYQRMAVLVTLKEIASPLLEEYLKLAKEDGRPYLVNLASEMEHQA